MTEKARLILNPDTELRFKGPFNNVVTTHLKLTNPLDKVVCFKVKTTAPRRYCVRPNIGYIKPKESADVAVMLQPSSDPLEKNKHKFMVQCVLAPDGDDLKNLDGILKSAPPESVVDCKLRCVLEDDTNQTPKPLSATGKGSDHIQSGEKVESGSLEAELAQLMEENRRLREQEARLKKLAMPFARPPGESVARENSHSSSNTATASVGLPPVLFLMVAFILGLILGKFLL